MSTVTKTLGLVKPSAEDFYNIDDFNYNFQKIDDFVGGRGYYIGNVDELKTPGTYVVATFSEGMSGTYPLPSGWWYTVIVSTGGTGSVIQDWILATEPNVPMRKFTRHFDANRWTTYFESSNTQNPIFPKDVTLQKAENGKTVLSKNHSGSADYGTEIIDFDGSGNKVKFTIKSNQGLGNAIGFSMNDSGYHKLYGEHNFVKESTEHPGCFYRMVDGEHEWVNPPMINGVEYRTTERLSGHPVYVKVVYDNTTDTNITISEPEGCMRVIDVSGYIERNGATGVTTQIQEFIGNDNVTVTTNNQTPGIIIRYEAGTSLSSYMLVIKYIKVYIGSGEY